MGVTGCPLRPHFLFLSKMCLLGWFPLISNRCFSVLLPPEGASFCQSCFPACRLTEDSGAADTQDYRLCMAKDRGDFIASWALHIHKVGIGALHQALFLVFPLFLLWRGMKEILCERHVLVGRSSPPERQCPPSYTEVLNNSFCCALSMKLPGLGCLNTVPAWWRCLGQL